MIEPTRYNWPALIRELEGLRLTPYKIGLAIGLRSRDIIAIRDHNRRVEHYEGQLLLTLLRSSKNGPQGAISGGDPSMLSLRSLTT